MTAPTTQQNTVFTVASEVAVVPVRCAEGVRIRRDWSMKVKEATMETWQDVMGKGYMGYINHCIKCPDCMEYEVAKGHLLKLAKGDAIEKEEEK